jgi:photosystem II stability/assembly factor-like uncharacterized protein
MLHLRYLTSLLILFTTILASCNDDDEAPLPTWMNQGLGNHSITQLKDNSESLFAATRSGMYRKPIYVQDTSSWVLVGLSGMEVTDFVLIGAETLIASVALDANNPVNTLYKSVDEGNTWQPLESDFGGNAGNLTCQTLALSSQQPDVLYGRGQYNVAKSTDMGESWTSVLANWDNIGYQADLMYVDPNDAQIVWAGGETSIFSPYLFKSIDSGENWIPMDVPADGDNAVYSLVTHPTDNQRVLVGMEGQVVYTEDGGDIWRLQFAPENYSYFNDLALSTSAGDRVYAAGTDGGNDLGDILLYVSDDFGETWEVRRHEGEANREYAAQKLLVTTVEQQETIYVGTNQGVFRYNP